MHWIREQEYQTRRCSQKKHVWGDDGGYTQTGGDRLMFLILSGRSGESSRFVLVEEREKLRPRAP
jgi:hypothetical protein